MLERELLEKEARAEVCACRYYDLMDVLEECTDRELLSIINHTIPCEPCRE